MQNTGNPVLDSLVNIVCSGNYRFSDQALPAIENFKFLHKMLLELAAKEPGGLKAPLALESAEYAREDSNL